MDTKPEVQFGSLISETDYQLEEQTDNRFTSTLIHDRPVIPTTVWNLVLRSLSVHSNMPKKRRWKGDPRNDTEDFQMMDIDFNPPSSVILLETSILAGSTSFLSSYGCHPLEQKQWCLQGQSFPSITNQEQFELGWSLMQIRGVWMAVALSSSPGFSKQDVWLASPTGFLD